MSIVEKVTRFAFRTGRALRGKETPKPHPEYLYDTVCPYCVYDRPWERRPWALSRCNECQRHFAAPGYIPTQAEERLLLQEQIECERAQVIAQRDRIPEIVAADFAKRRYPNAGDYWFENGCVRYVFGFNEKPVVCTYEPLETKAGNMQLAILCMEYIKKNCPVNYDYNLSDGGFGPWNG